jgi:hypothetical protein
MTVQPVPHSTEVCIRWYPNIDDVQPATCLICTVYRKGCDHKIDVDSILPDNDIVDVTPFTMEPQYMPQLNRHQCDYMNEVE